MKKYIYIIFTALLFVACSNVETVEQGSVVKNITIEEAKKLISGGIQILDVRTAGEVAGGKIDGAINIDFYSNDFIEQVIKLDRSKPILVYCKSGGRSSGAARKMKGQGFVEIYNLLGGYDTWKTNSH